MKNTDKKLTVIELLAENFKRLKAVQIRPDAATVTISGRNAQGKSSVLDALWAALGGSSATKGTGTNRPVRDGEKKAIVTVDLGEFIVTRTWTGKTSKLTIETKDGSLLRSPQKILDGLIGKLSFDPLAFTLLPAKKQVEQLLELVDLPFDPEELDQYRADVFVQRTEVGREVKRLRGSLDSMVEPEEYIPSELVSIADIAAELSVARRVADRLRRAEEDLVTAEKTLKRAQENLEESQTRLEATRDDSRGVKSVDEIENRLARVEETNDMVRSAQAWRETNELHVTAASEYVRLTKELDEIDSERMEGLEAAVFPVEGLSFNDEGVLYKGLPFSQASSAEQLRVSVAMAMAANPQIRIIRITDGSLLDSENLAIIEDMAKSNDFQVWLERVDESGKVGVVIEDGLVKENKS